MKKRHVLGLLACLLLALAATPQAPQPPAPSLARWMPPGASLYLEAKDFQSLLHDWNQSPEKQLWLASDNYQAFSRTRLFLKLRDAQDEFAQAAGFRADMPFLESVAGESSALGIYDIGKLEFLYVTRLPAARALESVLGKARERFEPRKIGEQTYYVRADKSTHRVAAFAVTGDYLVVATRESLITDSLQLISEKGDSSLVKDPWFADAVRAAGAPGDLRLALNMQALVRSPYFRSYWIQGKVSDLRQYESEIADVNRSPAEIREDRVLVRANPPEACGGEALGEILRFVPDDAGVFRAWGNPGAGRALDLVERKILAPRLGAAPTSKIAPTVSLAEGKEGTGDLETRIDQAPLSGTAGALRPEALEKLFRENSPQAVLQVESTRPSADGVFVGTESAVVVSAAGNWSGEAARAALREAVETLWSVSGLGTKWVERQQNGKSYFELDGLNHLAMAAEGHFLFVATGPKVLMAALERASRPASSERGVYAAGIRHAREREQLRRMLRLIETPYGAHGAAFQPRGGHTPLFFSENLGSLSRSLARVESETILIKDHGDRVNQTVRYVLSR